MRARWLLDTCVLSELAKANPHEGVQGWLASHKAQCQIATASVGEIAYGIERLPVGARRNALQRWSDALSHQFSARMLVTDERVWLIFGRLKASLQGMGRPQDDLDIIIAATAAAHGLTLVTRNLRHFKDTGLELVDPWGSAAHGAL